MSAVGINIGGEGGGEEVEGVVGGRVVRGRWAVVWVSRAVR